MRSIEKQDQIPEGLRKIVFNERDTEGKNIYLDAHFEISDGKITESIDYIKSIYPEGVYLLPMSGRSAGGGTFHIQKPEKNNATIVGITITPPASITASVSEENPAKFLTTHQIHINKKEKTVFVGAGVTLDQINETIQEELGQNYIVLGTDLTSSGTAAAGATFMTGGMGPSRVSFGSSSVIEAVINNGKSREIICGKELSKYSETYGLTGFVESIKTEAIEFPQHKFGFVLPINDEPEELGKLAEYWGKNTEIKIENKRVINNQPIITGLEIISGYSLRMLQNKSNSLGMFDPMMSSFGASGKNAVIFVTGYSQQDIYNDPHDSLGIFAENSDLALEYAFPFENLQAMKNIREAAPEIARSQSLGKKFNYKSHTDINVRLDQKKLAQGMAEVMKCYCDYKTKILDLIEKTDDLKGIIQSYGHLNPQGVDPHYRITFGSDNEKVLEKLKKEAQNYFLELVVNIAQSCQKTGSVITGGEKGLPSNKKIIKALKKENLEVTPELQIRHQKQIQQITKTPSDFSQRSSNLA